jgi:hypothetical protein
MSVIASEAHVKREVKRLLDTHDYFWFMPPANGYGTTGIADILALHRPSGAFIAIETKFGKNKPTAMQRGFLQTIHSCQAMAFVVNEKTIDALKSYLELFDKSVKAFAEKRTLADEDAAAMLDAIHALTEDFA